MQIVNREISEVLKNTVTLLYGDKEIKPVEISAATNEKFGDYQSNFAMINSKIIGKKPSLIANDIKENLIDNEIIEKIEIAGPGFINIFLKDSYLSKFIKKLGDEKYDFSFLNRKGEVIIDFSSPNIAKRMHIGHLRSTIIGDSVCRIYEYLGYNVVRDNHIGDWGTQFGKLILGYRKWLDQAKYEENPIEELERVYVEFGNHLEENSSLEEESRYELKKLQDRDEENYNLWKKFIEVSLEEYSKIYKRLDVRFDTFNGESFYHPIMPEVVRELTDKNIAKEDDGAKVVFFEDEENLFPCIIEKKDGAFLYSTSDIATIKYRRETYDVNKIIYLTDERQQSHFKQIFKIAELLGWNEEKIHVWFGIMRFEDGIFSTRKGNVIRLEELLDEAKRRAYEIVNEKNPELSEEEKDNIAEVVGIGAVKYADLSQNRQSPVIFSWDKILNFEGNTAPYLLYSYARIQALILKLSETGVVLMEDSSIIFTDRYERALALYMTAFPISVLNAALTCKPNLIADYLFELAKKFNSFYNNCPILNQPKEVMISRLLLSKKTGELLKEGLSLLGIETLNRM